MKLRPAADRDRQFVEAIRNDPEIIAVGMSQRRAPRSWFPTLRKSMWIIVSEDGQRRGYAILAPVMEVSIALVQPARGHGLGTEAIRALVKPHRHALARIFPKNIPSLKAFTKAGFVQDCDHVVMFKA